MIHDFDLILFQWYVLLEDKGGYRYYSVHCRDEKLEISNKENQAPGNTAEDTIKSSANNNKENITAICYLKN